ncbi:multidrug MFS transporter [Bacillus sp. FJAT-18017]|uniref:TIGR01777 family oxidoreductase n=1 Tax=Bacillus sp. FJAT-18017 TaxID=1705566 RepID=UPI0006B06525|nr:TIGR01777 family oxidoreductase [Bacillus sp. FJAT-18017]ALC92128.1 multidrug MFS transporter [Bacillus sp. FJAT-18017]
MKLAIAGGTGFLGNALVDTLLSEEHEIVILTRKKTSSSKTNLTFVQWMAEESQPERYLEGIEVFINLAGESLNSGRWTTVQKEKLLKSRLDATNEAIRILSKLSKKPSVYISASAVGVYGTSEDKLFTEESSLGQDFLASLVKQWEDAGSKAEELGIRTVFCRFGIILDREESALPQMVFPYKLFGGGTVGSGSQWISWIHREDAVGAILFIIKNNSISGAVNFTSPNPTTMKEFGQTIGQVLRRPHWLPVPSFALKLLLGEMSILVLKGQRVMPVVLVEAGYQFRFPQLKKALEDLFSK